MYGVTGGHGKDSGVTVDKDKMLLRLSNAVSWEMTITSKVSSNVTAQFYHAPSLWLKVIAAAHFEETAQQVIRNLALHW